MKGWIIRLSLVVLALLLAVPVACTDTQQDTIVKVVRVIDGDTVVLGSGARVRYIGIDTPEEGAPFYQEAAEANRRLVEGKTVRLEMDTSNGDRYGRLLRYVYRDDVMVNLELVKQGLAEAKAYPPDTKYQTQLEAAELEARAAGLGMWSAR